MCSMRPATIRAVSWMPTFCAAILGWRHNACRRSMNCWRCPSMYPKTSFMIDRLLVRRWGLLHSGRLGHVPHKVRLGLRADELHGVIDDDLRHSVHVVSFCQVGKFAGFNDIGPHVGALDCQERGQPGRAWTVRSGGSDKHLQVDLLRQA